MNNEHTKEAVMFWFIFATMLFLVSMFVFIDMAKVSAENDYLRQQIEDQKVIIKELKEGKYEKNI